MPVLVAVRDLVFRSKIQAAAERLGVPVRLLPRGTPLSEAARTVEGDGTVIADLGEPGALDEVRLAKRAGRVRVIGFLGHLQTDLARAAEEAGVDEVLSRGQLVQRLDELLLAGKERGVVHPTAAPGVALVDTGYVRPGLAAAWIVSGRRSAAVVETGASSSVPRILAALEAGGIPRGAVSHVVVTHVHLDHAGGAGALLRELPRAALVVHPRGARHLVDPAKLVQGSIAVYGEARFHALYGEIVPVPAARVLEAPEGFSLDLGDRPLRFLDAPGHARHHLVVLDEATRGFFTGDSFGLSYRETDVAGRPFLFPTTTPVQLDPPALHATIDRMVAERPERMYLTHFGALEGRIDAHAEALHRAVDEHVRLARAAPAGPGRHAGLVAALEGQLLAGLAAHGATLGRAEAIALFGTDLELNAQGLEVWLDSSATRPA
jgi:glyoxylase-like metal-dependent hydrolase (beta-lactamase superfamily II)